MHSIENSPGYRVHDALSRPSRPGRLELRTVNEEIETGIGERRPIFNRAPVDEIAYRELHEFSRSRARQVGRIDDDGRDVARRRRLSDRAILSSFQITSVSPSRSMSRRRRVNSGRSARAPEALSTTTLSHPPRAAFRADVRGSGRGSILWRNRCAWICLNSRQEAGRMRREKMPAAPPSRPLRR